MHGLPVTIGRSVELCANIQHSNAFPRSSQNDFWSLAVIRLHLHNGSLRRIAIPTPNYRSSPLIVGSSPMKNSQMNWDFGRLTTAVVSGLLCRVTKECFKPLKQ